MIDYKKIISNYGTPTYIYDVNSLLSRVDYLKNCLNGNGLVYAVKANTFIAKELEEAVERFEICSPGEYHICKDLNISDSKMVISGVYKDEDTIDEIMKNSNVLRYTIESMNQYMLLDRLSTKYEKEIHVLIRLTSGNQFGVNADELKEIIRTNKNPYIIIEGIEYFSGTQKHSIKRIEKEIDKLRELVDDIENNLKFEIKEIEYGPGLPIFYFQDDEFDESEFLEQMEDLLKRLSDKHVSLEIGRSIASSCGTYLTSVVDMKTNKNGNFALVDGGIHHLVYYGQTMAMRIPYFDLIQDRLEDEDVYNLYGSLCTINDCLVKNLKVNKLHIGDAFAFKNVGAYSATEGISLFLSRDLPKVVLIDKNNNTQLLRDTIKTSDINYPRYEGDK